MTASSGTDVSVAGAVSAIAGEVVVHPLDTIITRMQSSVYVTRYKDKSGCINRALFRGLYQGFGPTLIANIPSSASFFLTYEASKGAFERARQAGYLNGVPQAVSYIVSSALGEIVACAIANPAEVLKQNAQVVQQDVGLMSSQRSPTLETLKQFRRQPSKLWAGYTTLIASQLPSMCLSFGIYETLKDILMDRMKWHRDDVWQQVKASSLTAGVAASSVSWFFVPVDVVKTRIRLAAGEEVSSVPLPEHMRGPPFATGNQLASFAKQSHVAKNGPIQVARDIIRKEGVFSLFRGSILTCVASGLAGGLCIGIYEGCRVYLGGLRNEEAEQSDKCL